jgi:hypothetical protein
VRLREVKDHPTLVSEPRSTNKSRLNILQEKLVVVAPTQGPMCKRKIVGVIPHQLWPRAGGHEFISVRKNLIS